MQKSSVLQNSHDCAFFFVFTSDWENVGKANSRGVRNRQGGTVCGCTNLMLGKVHTTAPAPTTTAATTTTTTTIPHTPRQPAPTPHTPHMPQFPLSAPLPFSFSTMSPASGCALPARSSYVTQIYKKSQANSPLGGQGPDYCQACTDTIQATSHV